MSKALCKNRYYKDLISNKKVCLGMSKVMVESAWRMPYRKYEGPGIGEETWEWGANSHSRVVFNSGGVARSVYSVVHHAKGETWSR